MLDCFPYHPPPPFLNGAMYRALPLALLLVLSACAASVRTSVDTTYRDDDFSTDALSGGGLAILPVVAGEGSEGYRRPFGQSINRAVDSLNALNSTAVEVTHWNDTMQLLNDAGLTSEYQSAIEAYRTTSVLDRAFLGRLAEATGSRYMLFLLLGDYDNDSSTTYSLFSRSSNTRETAGVTAFAQIWDTTNSDVVWEGAAAVDAEANSGSFQYMRAEQRDPNFLSRKAADALAAEIFSLR